MYQKIIFSILLTFIVIIGFSQECSSVVSTVNNGNIQIVIFSENGECFKTKLINQYLFPGFSNQITFLESDGLKKIKIEMITGENIEKTIAINTEYKKAMFQIKKNKKGDYVLKLMPFQTTTNGPTANELMIKAEKDLEEFEAENERERQQRIKDKEDKKRKEAAEEAAEEAQKVKEEKDRIAEEKRAAEKPKESSTNTSSTNSSLSQSTGSTKVTLRIMYGDPANMQIRIGYKGNIIGSGTTDNSGKVIVYTNSLISKSIDVYGESNGGNWSMEGFTKLDANNYAEVDPTKAIAKMLETFEKIYNIDDQSDEEIMEIFGQ